MFLTPKLINLYFYVFICKIRDRCRIPVFLMFDLVTETQTKIRIMNKDSVESGQNI